MRMIDRSSAFKHDYKRETKGRHRATLDDDLKPVRSPWRRISPWMPATAITIFLAIGQAIGNVISSPTCC